MDRVPTSALPSTSFTTTASQQRTSQTASSAGTLYSDGLSSALQTPPPQEVPSLANIQQKISSTFKAVSKDTSTFFLAAMISEALFLPFTLMQVLGQVSGSTDSFKDKFSGMVRKIKEDPAKVAKTQFFSASYRAIQRSTHVTGMLVALELMNTNKKDASIPQLVGAAVSTQLATNWAICLLDAIKINALSSIVEQQKPGTLSQTPTHTPTQSPFSAIRSAIHSGGIKANDLKLPFNGYSAMCMRNAVTFSATFFGQQLGGLYSVMLPVIGAATTSPFDFAKNYGTRHAGRQLGEILSAAKQGHPRPELSSLQFSDVAKITAQVMRDNLVFMRDTLKSVWTGAPAPLQPSLKLGTALRASNVGLSMAVMFGIKNYLDAQNEVSKPQENLAPQHGTSLSTHLSNMPELYKQMTIRLSCGMPPAQKSVSELALQRQRALHPDESAFTKGSP